MRTSRWLSLQSLDGSWPRDKAAWYAEERGHSQVTQPRGIPVKKGALTVAWSREASHFYPELMCLLGLLLNLKILILWVWSENLGVCIFTVEQQDPDLSKRPSVPNPGSMPLSPIPTTLASVLVTPALAPIGFVHLPL